MRFAIMTEPQQGLTYEEILAVARTAEAAGFEAFFRSDHYGAFPADADLPTTDCWATLAGLARDTKSIRLGTLVSPVTFRVPGSFAKVVMTVDEMSGGRVEVGVGAGWNDVEHAQLGIPFPEITVRGDMLEEELAMLNGFWEEPDGWSFSGQHWQVREAKFRPRERPEGARPDGRLRPSIIVGGTGKGRSLRLAARYADEYNISGMGPANCAQIVERLDAACRAIGRDPSTLVCSAMVGTLVAESDAAMTVRVQDQLRAFGMDTAGAETWLNERTARWIFGTPDAARARMAEFEGAGVQRVMFQDFVPRDLEMVGLLGRIFLS